MALPRINPEMVVTAYESHKMRDRNRKSMATANWPTTLAHDCEAYAFYNRTVPGEKRRQIGANLAMIFSEGNDQARMVKRDLEAAGFDVSGEEEQMTWPKYQISGRRDLLLWKEGFKEKVRVEVKSCSVWTFDAINSVEDMMDTDKHWLAKWWKQVALYMILQSVERYWMLLKNKQNGKIKIIEFVMNDALYEAAEKMIAKAERVNKLIQIGGLPTVKEKISDPDYCSECEFYDTCLPAITFGPGAAVLTDEDAADMEARLNRRKELKPMVDEYKELDDDLKEEVKGMWNTSGVMEVVAGDWIGYVKESKRKEYTVKAQSVISVKFMEAKSKEGA